MASITDPGVRALLEDPENYAVVSTLNADGSIHSAVVWISAEDGGVAVNSALGRRWPTNLERDPRVTILVHDHDDWYDYVEIEGRAEATTEGADEHIDRLSKKYTGQDEYPYRQPGEQRIKFLVEPTRVRHMKQ
jgi:PPOX class probable F420-dependent enzyme